MTSWFTADTTQSFGWTLIHFLWEGTALALALYIFLRFARQALVRYTAGVAALALMLAAPIATFLILSSRQSPQPSPLHEVVRDLGTVAAATVASSAPVVIAKSIDSIDWALLLTYGWLAGVFAFTLRALGGWLIVERLHRSARQALSPQLVERCRALQGVLRITRTVRFFQSASVASPTVIGWFRPVVLIPVSALTGLSPAQLETVILHELAHIRRLDAFVNLFQIAAETLLFYHPAIWWVNRIIRAERENCCDDVAVAVSGNPGDYARALTLLESWRAVPSFALAATGGRLKSRVQRLMGLEMNSRSVVSSGLIAGVLLSATAAILAAASFNQTDGGRATPEWLPSTPGTPVLSPLPAVAPPAAPQTSVAPLPPTAWIATESVTAPAPKAPPAPEAITEQVIAEAPAPPAPNGMQASSEPSTGHGPSYIDGLRSAGLTNLTVDQLIALKIQCVTPDFVREMRSLNLDTTVNDLIALKVQDVTPDYVRKIRAAWPDARTNQVIELKVQGVDPADVAKYREVGLSDLKLNQIVAFRVQGITPEYIRGMQQAGFANLKANEYIAAKVQGITPEFVQKVRDHGFHDLTINQLIGLKTADVF